MKSLADLSTVEEVDDFIDNQICRHMPGLRARAESHEWIAEERAGDPKLDAVYKALERRAQLAKRVETTFCDSGGVLNPCV